MPHPDRIASFIHAHARGAGVITAALTLFAPSALGADTAQQDVAEIVVQGDASLAEDFSRIGNFARIDEDVIESIGIVHINEALVRVPGVWVSRGSGQESLTAIRSPVLTGPGACGAFSVLENGVSIRPAGFCNVNDLFEIHTEQATAIEVVRGPASALYGGNALRGVINVVAPTPGAGTSVSLDGGRWDFGEIGVRSGLETSRGDFGVAFTGTTTNGWRDDTGYDQQKLSLTWDTLAGDWQVATLLSATNLNQETGGFVVGFEAYEDGDLRDTNPNPEAYRDAWAVRLSSEWVREFDGATRISITPYLRASDMDFLQHFLPGQPLEENDQQSGGFVARWHDAAGAISWTIGVQAEYAETSLQETQDGPTTGSPFLVETRPAGTHYDYDVDSTMLAMFYDVSWQVNERLTWVHSLRLESVKYDYENNFLVGNTRPDGSTCGFGGCLYTRPDDRDDRYTDLAGRLGLEYVPVEGVRTWATAGIGFRAPQITELYRLQRGQVTADLDSESIDSVEIGVEAGGERGAVSLVGFAQQTDDEILRDANGFNISAGKTRSRGVEFSAAWAPGDQHDFDLVGTWASHEYDFDRAISGGNTIESGDDVDTAPNWMGSAHWRYTPTAALQFELEGVYVGDYEIDPSNSDDYRGHLILNLRGGWQLTEHLHLSARVLNLTDERYADRADLAFGNYRYFPGLPRRAHVAVKYDF